MPEVNAQTTWEVRPITFPVIGTVTYYDDFGAPRDGGARTHEGNDLMGKKMIPLVAAVDGTVRVAYPQEDYGYSITIRDKDNYSYHYLHVNNDTPGTDDGKGGGLNAYAVDVDDGAKVVAGQLIGWMGDSGNAETTTAHLHFEIRRPDRTPISPYGSLKAATKITRAVTPRPIQPGEILPYGEFNGGSFISAGNADSDSSTELVIGAGPTGGPHVKVVEQEGTPIVDFFPYPKTFLGGVDVAMADVNGDGTAEIITAPSSRGGPHVKIYSLAGVELGGFMAYDPVFQGGVNIATADIDGDNIAEIITAPGKGGGPHVRVFKMNGTEILSFFAYDQSFRGGIDIAAYSLSGQSYIVTSPSTGGGPHIKVFNKSGLMQSEFLAYDAAHKGGVRVSVADIDTGVPGLEIVTVPLLGGSQIKSFTLNGTSLKNDWGFEEWWPGSWDVAAARGQVFISSGPNTKRRASVRLSGLR
jgi:hypothetical protein